MWLARDNNDSKLFNTFGALAGRPAWPPEERRRLARPPTKCSFSCYIINLTTMQKSGLHASIQSASVSQSVSRPASQFVRSFVHSFARSRAAGEAGLSLSESQIFDYKRPRNCALWQRVSVSVCVCATELTITKADFVSLARKLASRSSLIQCRANTPTPAPPLESSRLKRRHRHRLEATATATASANRSTHIRAALNCRLAAAAALYLSSCRSLAIVSSLRARHDLFGFSGA